MFFPSNMNSRQKKILGSWRGLLWNFVKREWIPVFVSSGIGVLAAEGVHLLWRDQSFQSSLVSKYSPSWLSFDDPRYYIPYLSIALFSVFLAVALSISVNFWRGLKSWLFGVTSGLVLLPFASAFSISILPAPAAGRRLMLGSALITAWFLGSFRLYLRAKVRAARTVHEEEFTVPQSVRSLAGTQLEWSDDPIQTWTQDALGRAALVDSLSVKIMISKTPVIALSGPYGTGKTSVLNLLREHLGDKTITVSFSTWLPGSQETLTSYLLADIASQCKKEYIVPGLQRSTRQLATALGQKVPFLSEYLKLLPAATQKDHIESLKAALLRLPKRVVVLLDEIDRMEKEEIMTLLKVIKGIATLPNLSFVCAANIETMIQTTGKDNEYFQKFFPIIIFVPEPDPAALLNAGTDRLVSTFVSLDWFESHTEDEEFKKRIESLWAASISPFCTNLRTIGLLANGVSVAAAPLRGEVDAVDLTLVEMLKRFRPDVHKLIAKNSFALTGGESPFRGGQIHDDKDEEQARNKLLTELKQLLPKDGEFEQVQAVINELFPLVSKAERRLRKARRGPFEQSMTEETNKRISEPGIFPAYFRYELPDAIFSSVELKELLEQLQDASSQDARDSIFLRTLQSMEKGGLKRDDFLRKLAELAKSKSITTSTAQSLGEAAVKAADKYTYDHAFPMWGEAGHVLRLIHAVAHRLSQNERIAFLQKCVLDATDDTMAVDIVMILTRQKDESNLEVSVADLYPNFTRRMRNRYGRGIDIANIDLSTSDQQAFNLWGIRSTDDLQTEPEDRNIQYDFWRRYIGKSRTRLARVFRDFFLPFAIYEKDPEPAVENKIPIADLRKLYDELPEDPAMTDRDRKSLAALRRFLDGEFKNGIGPSTDLYGD